MAHATLIHPPTVLSMSSLSYTNSIPPLGLAYVSAAAKAAGHRVHVVDAPGAAIEEFHSIDGSTVENLFMHGLLPAEIVERIDPESQVVGITHMFLHAWPLLRHLIHEIKSAYPDKLVVMGGETPTGFWDNMMRESQGIDLCVLGEGEYTFVELLDALDRGTPMAEVAGLVYRAEDGTPTRSVAQRERIRAVDEIAWPDWEAFEVDAYLDHSYSSGVNRGRAMPMLATRGCPYQCTFCSSPEMWTTRYVTREPEKVVDEIEDCVKRYRADNIDFLDLTAIIKRKWILEFCEALMKRNLDITWQLPSGTRSEVIDREVLEGLYRSGCRNISYAPESGSPRMLKAIKKQVKLDSIVRSMVSAVDTGLVTNANLILGLPGERWRDIWQSYKLGVRLAYHGLHSLAVMMFAPYPGSVLFDELFEEGKIETNDEYYFSALLRTGKTAVSYNKHFGPRSLVVIQLFFLCTFWGLQYFFRPKRLLQTLYNFFKGDGSEESIMDNLLNTKRFYWKKRREAEAPVVLAG